MRNLARIIKWLRQRWIWKIIVYQTCIFFFFINIISKLYFEPPLDNILRFHHQTVITNVFPRLFLLINIQNPFLSFRFRSMFLLLINFTWTLLILLHDITKIILPIRWALTVGNLIILWFINLKEHRLSLLKLARLFKLNIYTH
jgi:hypothetical protein